MPGNTCFLCKSTWSKKVSMFTPPCDEYMKGEWDTACGMEIPRNSRLCAMHFTDEDFSPYSPTRKRLQPDAVPSLNIPVHRVKGRENGTVDKDNYKKARASMQQLLYYVRFARKHPAMLKSKYAAVKDLWIELAKALNAKKGVQRTPEKWKENLSTWRGQLRCRARQGSFSGIPEFDKFAANDFGLDTEEGRLMENAAQNTDDEPPTKKVKETVREESNNVISDNLPKNEEDMLVPDADVAIKVEIDSSDDDTSCHLLESCTSMPEYEVETVLGQVAEPYIKTEMDVNNTQKPAREQKQTKFSLKQKSVVKTITLPILGLTNAAPSGSVQTKSSVVTPPPQLQPKQTKVPSPQQAPISLEAESETSFVIRRTNTNQSSSNATEKAVFIIEEVTQSTPSAPSPTPQPPKHSETKRQHSLNQMYETVLKTIQRREERTDGIMEVLKSLTAAVTQLANNVKRLEEKLT